MVWMRFAVARCWQSAGFDPLKSESLTLQAMSPATTSTGLPAAAATLEGWLPTTGTITSAVAASRPSPDAPHSRAASERARERARNGGS